ncbi:MULTISPECIES: hypothetical protein [Flavobacterium]|uniref:Uncharacterized protein n=1 Tax=Flavobacterium lindanitolerans TaxID=428988 RepID=A0A497UZN5_9FLAO|nr:MULTISPECIES: hypothetical protein [Flavobacterium]OJX55174.1 MAG: hypothetical protein BGO88_03450 [Flavobacterium sp. 38-13]PKW21229.1 hypothetical protein B0G92_2513 [Flavobacterium lindanitolerans]RLJ30133.1 hypothetical protein CLV50_1537 [Flavobacterium lindanitolerans]
MKIVSLLLSIFVFGIAAYFFVTDFRNSFELNYIIYMLLLLILMSICVLGVMINIPLLIREKRKMNVFLYHSFSKKYAANSRRIRLKKHNYFKKEPNYQDTF